MRRVTREELEAAAPAWDALAAADPALDRFCARSAWALPFHDAFAPGRGLWLAHEPGGLVALAESQERPGLLEPLENLWGFGSPLVGPDSTSLLARSAHAHRRPVLLLGFPDDARRLRELAPAFTARALRPTFFFVASLAGGLDGWLARRSASFRRNLRAAERRTRDAGVRFRRAVPGPGVELDALYRRVLGVEARSWKAGDNGGAGRGAMRAFYAAMWPRLARAGELCVVLAERGHELVGYLHGARVGGHFRGLQFSFDERFRAAGLGNVLQLEMLVWLAEDAVQEYALGGQSEYKARWAEQRRETPALLLLPRG